MKNQPQHDYSRARFLALLEDVYQMYEENGYHDFPEYTKEKVADELACDPSTLTRRLGPNCTDSYKNLIKRLESIKELKGLRKRVSEIDETIQKQASNIATHKRSAIILRFLCAALAGACLILFFMKIKGTPSTDFVIQDLESLNEIRNYHGSLMTYRLFYEAARVNQRLRGARQKGEVIDESLLRTQIEEVIESTMSDGRNSLQSLDFVNSEGRNIVSILNSAYPTDRFFSETDTLFAPALHKVKHMLTDLNVNFDALLVEIENASQIARDDQWKEIWKRGFLRSSKDD